MCGPAGFHDHGPPRLLSLACLGQCIAQLCQRFVCVGGCWCVYVGPSGVQPLLQQIAQHGVAHQQQHAGLLRQWWGGGGRWLVGSQPQWGGKVKDAALPRGAVHANVSAHHAHQLAANGQPQPCAAKAAGDGRIGL